MYGRTSARPNFDIKRLNFNQSAGAKSLPQKGAKTIKRRFFIIPFLQLSRLFAILKLNNQRLNYLFELYFKGWRTDI